MGGIDHFPRRRQARGFFFINFIICFVFISQTHLVNLLLGGEIPGLNDKMDNVFYLLSTLIRFHPELE